ncbi:DUF1801 domain-containing protein [Archangium violaceum]|uniref:DUF1801 domain-containing protein n=1 Tax=Archangium violaceum TaxID=83451 RepID=UPI002B2AB8FF|nr:DUF1801 domain-containing protein [Archangium violaceum]
MATAKKTAPKKTAAKKTAPKKATAVAKPERAAPKESPMKGSTIDAYVGALETWQQEIARPFAALIAKVAPKSSAYIKWGHPVWDHGGPFALLKPAKAHVTLGFWRGGQMKDAEGLLEGDGDGMRYVKIKSGQQLPSTLAELVREAVALNAQHGDPLKR